MIAFAVMMGNAVGLSAATSSSACMWEVDERDARHYYGVGESWESYILTP